METTLVSLASTAMVIIATVTMMIASFQSAGSMADSWRTMEQQASDIRRTDISTSLYTTYTGGNVQLQVENTGQVNLSQFSRWDVIVSDDSGVTYRTTYTSDASPGSQEWSVQGIYLLNDSPEVFDPGILNPNEKMRLTINLQPEIGVDHTVRLTVTTPNGVTAQSMVTRVAPS